MRDVFRCALTLTGMACSAAAYAQGPTAPPALVQCATFNSLSDQHADQAQNLQRAIEAQAQTMPPDEGRKFIEEKSKATKSEFELAALAREAYRKCLKDYLQAGAAPAAPVQQAQPVQQVQPAPVQQAQPAPARPMQQQQYVRRQQTQPQQEQPVERPSLAPLIGFGIGLGRGF